MRVVFIFFLLFVYVISTRIIDKLVGNEIPEKASSKESIHAWNNKTKQKWSETYFNAPIFIDTISNQNKIPDELYLKSLKKIYNNTRITGNVTTQFKDPPKYKECKIKQGDVELKFNTEKKEASLKFHVRLYLKPKKISVKLSPKETIYKIDLRNITDVSLSKKNPSCFDIKIEDNNSTYKFCQIKGNKSPKSKAKDWVHDIKHFKSHCKNDTMEKDCNDEKKKTEVLMRKFIVESHIVLKKYEEIDNNFKSTYKKSYLARPVSYSKKLSELIDEKLTILKKCSNFSDLNSLIERFKENSGEIEKIMKTETMNKSLLERVKNKNSFIFNQNSIQKAVEKFNSLN